MNTLLAFIQRRWLACSLSVLGVITILSLRPMPELPTVSGIDKIQHLIAYAVLMFPTALRRPRRWGLIGFLFIAYSGAIELLQPYVHRYGDWLDLAANVFGIFCGVIAAALIRSFYSDISE